MAVPNGESQNPYPQPEATTEVYVPKPELNTKNSPQKIIELERDIANAKLGLIQLDALELAQIAVMAQLSRSPEVRRDQLVKMSSVIERFVPRVRELLT